MRILGDFPLVEEVNIKVVKPDPPIRGIYDSVAIEIQRDRTWFNKMEQINQMNEVK